MSTTATLDQSASPGARVAQPAMKLEAITVPVTDIDRAKTFYESLGWRLDADFRSGASRALQFTPPGSGASIHIGTGLTSAAPGSLQRLLLVVSDIQAARDDLVKRGAAVSEVFHHAAPGPFSDTVAGLAPGRPSYASLATFSDPDGNGWVLQEVTTRAPGRVTGETAYGSVDDLAQAMRRAETAHGEHEKRTGVRDLDWPTWYAQFMVAEQAGTEPPK